jgi:hypothetical protein
VLVKYEYHSCQHAITMHQPEFGITTSHGNSEILT